MKRVISTLMVMLIAGFIGAAAYAEGGERVKEAYKLLCQKIDKAENVVEESGNAEAKELLAKAQNTLDKAGEAIKNEKWELAGKEIQIAADYLRRAVEAANDKNRVEKAYERLLKLLAKAEEIVGNSENEKAKELLAEAKLEAEKAKQAMDEGSYKKAMAHILRATKLAVRAIELVKPCEAAEREYKRLLKLLTKAEEIVGASENEKAKEALEKAKAEAEKAKQAIDEGACEKALAHIHRATKLALLSIKLASSDDSSTNPDLKKRAQKMLVQTGILVKKAEEVVEENSNPKAEKVLAVAQRAYEQAKEAYEDGKYHICIKLCEAANRAAHRAIRLAQGESE